jgi:hypothetical protein
MSNRYVVRRYRVHPGKLHVIDVYEPYMRDTPEGSHSTITTIDGQWHGRVGTARLPAELDALPVGAARFAAVDAHYRQQYALAYRLIRRAFPEVQGKEDMGEVEFYSESPLPSVQVTLDE